MRQFTKTKDGLMQYRSTGVWYVNRGWAGKVIQSSTGHTSITKAKAWRDRLFDALKAGLNLEQARQHADGTQPYPLTPNPASAGPTSTAEPYPFTKAIQRLSQTLAIKQQEGHITSDRTIQYRRESITYVMRKLPGGPTRDMKSVTPAELEAFRKQILAAYSRSRYNGLMQNLRALFDEAVADGAILVNPCRTSTFKFKTLKVPAKNVPLPTDQDFADLCAEIRTVRNGASKHVVLTIKFLALTGTRITHASRILKTDVHLDDNIILFRKELMKGGRRATSRDVPFPLYGELRKVVEELLATPHRRGPFLLPVYDCYGSLQGACDRLAKRRNIPKDEFPHWTPHDFRHLFATKLLHPSNQKHISLPLAAKLLGHRDGGKLLLERYAHVIRQNELEAGSKITVFGS